MDYIGIAIKNGKRHYTDRHRQYQDAVLALGMMISAYGPLGDCQTAGVMRHDKSARRSTVAYIVCGNPEDLQPDLEQP